MNTKMDYLQYFEHKTRSDGAQFVCLTDEAPKDLYEMIFDIHCDHFNRCPPNDWIYQKIYEAFESLETDEFDNVCIEVDIYDYDLMKFQQERFAVERMDYVIQEGLVNPQSGIISIISAAQYQSMYDIFCAVNKFLNQNNEQMENT